MTDRTYIAFDLKSFYASVECADLHLDPMATRLVVADQSRTDKDGFASPVELFQSKDAMFPNNGNFAFPARIREPGFPGGQRIFDGVALAKISFTSQDDIFSIAKLTKQPLPHDWNEQRRMLGFGARKERSIT